MAYSEELREKVMKYIGKGHTLKEAREVFEVGITTIGEWKKRDRP
jgi:transposase